MAAAMVDGVYQDIFEALKPGARENEIVALATKRLYEMGSDCVEAINAISGERCSPHPHNFTDRLIRPGDQAFFDIIMSYVGYRTCYYRTFSVGRATRPQVAAYKKAREWMDEAIALIKPGVTTDKIARASPGAGDRIRERDGASVSTSATDRPRLTSARSSADSTPSTTRWSWRPG
jgi:Xaa-Pro dipeptidase